MPDRIVKASIIRSKKVNSLSWQAECLYRRLINVVDDFGLYYADPMVLRADLFPMKLDKVKNADITKWLGEVRTIGLIAIYEVEDEWYLKLFNTGKPRASNSKYPLPSANICEQMIADANKCTVVVNVVDVVGVVDKGGSANDCPEELAQYKTAWDEWVSYKNIKHKATLTKLVKLFKQLGPNVQAAVDSSIANGYAGLFAPKGGKQSTRHTTLTLTDEEIKSYEGL